MEVNMFHKKTGLILSLGIILVLGFVSIVQAAPPQQEGSQLGSVLGETLDLDNEDGSADVVDEEETDGHNNLGTIMSGPKETDEADADVSDSDGDGIPDADEGAEDTPDSTKQHPVASAIADYFGVDYEEIMSLHEAGNGFGNITKAYFFADKLDSPLIPEDLLQAAHESGWGNVLKDNGIHPGSVGNGSAGWSEHAGHPENVGPGHDGPPGQVKKGDNLTGSATDGSNLLGQGGNNGNGKGNNGNGSGNNGNGNGKGNNGQGNNGKGHNK
jgi:hypothetical protein